MRYNWYGILEGTTKLSSTKWFLAILAIGIAISFLAIRLMVDRGISFFESFGYICFGWFVFLGGAVLIGTFVGKPKE